MRILVTGATGRIGSRFVPRLLGRGDSVRLLVRQAERAESLRQRGAEIITGDLLDAGCVERAVASVDAVVHLAAFFRGATPEQATAVNEKSTLALAQAALQAGVPRFVFVSTQLVYGPGRSWPLLEAEELHPTTPYPITKASAERALYELHQVQGLGLRILRLAFVYGEGDPHLAELLPMIRSWDPARRIQMVHHADVGQALALVTHLEGIDGRTYNVADDAPLTVAEILHLHGESFSASFQPTSADDPWDVIANPLRIRDELGYRPIFPSLYAARDASAL